MKSQPGSTGGGGKPKPPKPYGTGFSDSWMGNKNPGNVKAKPKARTSRTPRVAESKKK